MSTDSGFRRLLRGESNIDFIGRSKLWLTISTIVIGGSLLVLFTKELTLGLEFSGGTALEAPMTVDLQAGEIEDQMAERGFEGVRAQITRKQGTDERRVLVRSERIDPDRLQEARRALAEVAGTRSGGAVNPELVEVTDVGPTWGEQVSRKALRALIVFLVVVSAYISIRFERKMAVGALAALFHDLIATAGIYALAGFEVTPATVIALLTLMGFSLYDTVVVFDRVRESAPQADRHGSYSAMVNRSVNEVLVRSINTSVSSVLPVGGLLFVGVFLFGAVTLKDLALAMFVGALVSTYSSIFVAAPLLAWLKEREPRYRELRARTAARERSAVREAPAAAPPAAETTTAGTTTATAERPAPRAPRQAPRPRKQRRGKRR